MTFAISQVFAIGTFFLLLSVCGDIQALYDQFFYSHPPNPPILSPPNNISTIVNETQNTSVITPSPIDAQWTKITNTQAQKGCLKQAKKVAVDQGYPASFVYSCTCKATESETTKSYNCIVATADIFDPNKPVSIYCVKSSNTCTVTSGDTVKSFSFDELEKFANE